MYYGERFNSISYLIWLPRSSVGAPPQAMLWRRGPLDRPKRRSHAGAWEREQEGLGVRVGVRVGVGVGVRVRGEVDVLRRTF